MRILHTADWHLNEMLGSRDRSDDLRRSLTKIAGYLDEHHVDVMLVAGDVFCERSRAEQLRQGVHDVREIFLPFLSRGGTILAISGNHDSEVFFDTLRDALDLVAPSVARSDGSHATGRLYVAAAPRVVRLADRVGQVVQFALMPYPTVRYLRGGEPVRYATVEEKHLKIRERFLGTLQKLKEQEIEPRLPSVLVSHALIRGAQVHSYRLSEADDVVFDPAHLPTAWAYVAYGHIHRPQEAVPGATHIRYAGSIERLDLGEADDEKSVVLCEIGRAGLLAPPVTLSLESTPFYQIEIAHPETDLPGLRDRYPDHERALVQYTLHYDPARHDRDTLCQAINEIFPRWYARQLIDIGRVVRSSLGNPSAGALHLGDVAGTVRAYLSQRLNDHPDATALIALADSLLADAPTGMSAGGAVVPSGAHATSATPNVQTVEVAR